MQKEAATGTNLHSLLQDSSTPVWHEPYQSTRSWLESHWRDPEPRAVHSSKATSDGGQTSYSTQLRRQQGSLSRDDT